LAKNEGKDVTGPKNKAREKSLDEKPQPLRDSEFRSDY